MKGGREESRGHSGRKTTLWIRQETKENVVERRAGRWPERGAVHQRLPREEIDESLSGSRLDPVVLSPKRTSEKGMCPKKSKQNSRGLCRSILEGGGKENFASLQEEEKQEKG